MSRDSRPATRFLHRVIILPVKSARRVLIAVPWLVGGVALAFLLAGTEVVPVLFLYVALGAACLPGALLLARRRRAERSPQMGLSESRDASREARPTDPPGVRLP